MKKIFNLRNKKINEHIEFMFILEGINSSIIQQLEKQEECIFNAELDYNPEYSNVYTDYWFEWWNENNSNFIQELKSSYQIEKVLSLNYFEIKCNDNLYFLNYHYEIENENSMIINFEIASQNNIGEYDKTLEEIKMCVKSYWSDLISKRGDECKYKLIWLDDTQSTILSNKCHLEIHILENLLRKFINEVMNYNCGLNWQEIFFKSKIAEKQSRGKSYMKSVEVFKNIDDFLLSLDITDLVKIMEFEQKFISINNIKRQGSKSNGYLTEKELYGLINEAKKKTIWELYFSTLFDIESKIKDKKVNMNSNFRKEWLDLCDYRNHIAHNKFIDYKFYNNLLYKIRKLTGEIKEAAGEFYLHVDKKNTRIEYDLLTNQYIGEKELHSRKEREFYIFTAITLFCKRIKEYLENNKYEIIEGKEGFNYYELTEDREKEFIKFVELFLNEDKPIVFLKAKNRQEIVFQISKKKGFITTYNIEYLHNSTLSLKTEIEHNGYDFCCEGINEDQPFLGGNWSNFEFDVKRIAVDKDQVRTELSRI